MNESRDGRAEPRARHEVRATKIAIINGRANLVAQGQVQQEPARIRSLRHFRLI